MPHGRCCTVGGAFMCFRARSTRSPLGPPHPGASGRDRTAELLGPDAADGAAIVVSPGVTRTEMSSPSKPATGRRGPALRCRRARLAGSTRPQQRRRRRRSRPVVDRGPAGAGPGTSRSGHARGRGRVRCRRAVNQAHGRTACCPMRWTEYHRTPSTTSDPAMRFAIVLLMSLAVARPVGAAPDDRDGWYLVKALPGARITITQHPMTEYGCEVQASVARMSAPEALAECVYLQPPAEPSSVPVSPRHRLPASYS